MTSKKDNTGLIEGYFDGSLSDSEKKIFQEKIKNSKEFEEEFRVAQSILTKLESNYVDEKKKKLRSLYEKTLEESAAKPFSRKFQPSYFYWAAAAVLIIASSVYLFNISKPEKEEIFLAYYEPYPPYAKVRGDNESPLKKTMDLYRSGSYEKAIPGFTKYLENSNNEAPIYLLLGNCYLNTNQFQKARHNFEIAEQSDDILISQNGSWYLTLSYLKEKNNSKTKEKLESILDKGETQLYYKQAKSLIKLL